MSGRSLIKGGRRARLSATVPMEDFNLHLTGDIHAIAASQPARCAD